MVEIQTHVSLAPFTTLKIGGKAVEFVVVRSDKELIEALEFSGPILLLGGGSNLLISDNGFNGRVVHINTHGIEQVSQGVKVAAGESWDKFVTWAVSNGYGQLAPLTGIPGTVGATPIQNVGAYGTEVSELISSVEVLNRDTKATTNFSNENCQFSYRSSIFKTSPGKYVVLSVTFQLDQTNEVKVKYDELAKKLGIEVNSSASAWDVFNAVRDLRSSKGMLLDETDRDTYSVGSFFLNPRITSEQRAQLPSDAPSWLQPDGMWKVSAAWLINQAGFNRGFEHGNAGLSTKHPLAIINRNNATAKEVISLAKLIQTRVLEDFGIKLELEPQII
ncbi:MAG: UDP-N-acetylmuramate dehydrogenase [Candidatus Nanopelagicales bacterium]